MPELIWNTFVAISGILLMMTAWVLVQNRWRLVFADLAGDVDALASRGGGCGSSCSRRCDKAESGECARKRDRN